MPPDPLQGSNIDNSTKKTNKNTDTKKGKGGIIALVVVLLLVVAVVAVIALNVGGTRDRIAGYLRNAPLIGSFFSEAEDEDAEEVMTEEQMRARIRELETHNRALEGQRDEARALLAEATERNTDLSMYVTRWEEYRRAVADFGQMLTHNEPIQFVEFFQRFVDHDLLSQNVMDRLYEQALQINISNAELRALVSTFNNMEENRAAEDLVQLQTTNSSLAVRLLREMSPSRRAALFDQMEPADSTRFTILLSSDPPTFGRLELPPELPEITPQTETPPPTPPPADDEEDETEPQADEETD